MGAEFFDAIVIQCGSLVNLFFPVCVLGLLAVWLESVVDFGIPAWWLGTEPVVSRELG